MLSSLVLRLKALSPFHIAALAILALAVLGSSTAVASKLITGADVKDLSLTGRDIARDTVSQANLKAGSVTSRNIKNGTVQPADLSADMRAQLASSGAGGGVGKDVAKGEKGDAGAQGPKGDAGAVGAPGAFLVKDADNVPAGTLLSSDLGNSRGDVYYQGHSYLVDLMTGMPTKFRASFEYTNDNCTGTQYASVERPVQMALWSPNPSDAAVYGYGAVESVQTKSHWYSGPGGQCVAATRTSNLARMNVLSADDTLPTLRGPLRFVPAG